MVFVSRKIVYPFFLVVFSLFIFGIIYISVLSSSLAVNDPSVSVVADKIVLKMQIENKSSHEIKGISVLVKNGISDTVFFLKGSEAGSMLGPNEKYDFVASIPLGEALNYSVEIKSLLNKSLFLNFNLEQSTIDPVKAEVALPKELVVGQEYTYPVKLCNKSDNDLSEVYWIPAAKEGDFKEVFYEQVISLKKASCETLYSTLTPNKTGDLGLSFLMKVGSIEKRTAIMITVVDKNS